MLATNRANFRRSKRLSGSPGSRIFSAFIAMLLAVVGLVSVPSMAMAEPVAVAGPNGGIAITEVTIGSGKGPGGQLIVGDKVMVSGTWDAKEAEPESGQTFSITLPSELNIPANVPFNLTGPRPNGTEATWATCMTSVENSEVVCTLTEEVNLFPELVSGKFSFEVEAVEVTKESDLSFGLNGTDTPIELPGGGGIDNGVVLPTGWGKSGEMNSNNWSMTWTIELPGVRMKGQDVINIVDTLGTGHQLCEPAELKVFTVRGDKVTEVKGIGEITPGKDAQKFNIALTAPQPAGFDPEVTYRVTYETCTPDGQIDPVTTEYSNEAEVTVWGESSGVIGVNPKPWHDELTKTGTVLGGADRNGKISWTVTVPGDQLVGKSSFRFAESVGAGHSVCPDTISGIRITERKGPSNQQQNEITSKLSRELRISGADIFILTIKIKDSEPDFKFKASDYRYLITYETCVNQNNLPGAGTTYGNTVHIDETVATGEAEVPGREKGKSGSINSESVTLDGVEHLPQTTMNWNITVPGEQLAALTGDLKITDTLSESHVVCMAGDESMGLAARLGLKVEARDQIQGGGLATVDLASLVSPELSANGVLTFKITPPNLTQPGGGKATGFSKEYQYVITYNTCTTSGGMDIAGTIYGNTAVVNGKEYTSSVQQNNRGSGTGTGVSRGTVSIKKLLEDTPGAAFVPDGTTFKVYVREVSPNGFAVLEYTLDVPLNGDPVSGLNPRGTGWKIILSEPTFPNLPGVYFGDPVFTASEGVTLEDGGRSAVATLTPASNISVELTNKAVLGSVSIEKGLVGGAAHLIPEGQLFEVTAHIDTSNLGAQFPAQPDRTLQLKVGEPVVLDNLPIGAVVTFTEVVPATTDQLTWGRPVFSPNSVLVRASNAIEPAEVWLTNSVERTVGTFALTKTVTGAQADNPAVPDTVTVTAKWSVDGEPGQTSLVLPTDGTPVSLGESLLIGTEVTLTEEPLHDGSSIAWGAPVWSGTGVKNDGESAIVTIGRDADALVEVKNQAATSVAGISLIKGIVGEAAEEVDSTTNFPVTATWTDAEGVPQSKELTINAVTPTSLGVDLPAGTVVTIVEGEQPNIPTVTWGDITISGENVTDNGDGSAQIVVSDQQGDNVLATVTNEATWALGTFSLSKNVTGQQANNPAVPDTVTVTAKWSVHGTRGEKTLTIPTDGTAVSLGENLLIGTEVTLTEEPLDDGSSIAWGAAVWSGAGVQIDGESAVVTIGRDADALVELENHAATSVAGISLIKGIAGEAAEEVDPATNFPVTATWTDVEGVPQSKELTINAVTPTSLGVDLPAGTVVTIVEGEQPDVATVTWGSITISGKNVTDNGDGSAQIVVSDQQGDNVLATVTNEATWAPGTFFLSKNITGVLQDNQDVPQKVTVIASWLEDGETVTAPIEVPTDGTAVPFGKDLPHGLEVTLAETELAESAAFSWDDPTWEAAGVVVNDDNTAIITIGAATDLAVTLTNNATATLGSLSVTKSLVGDGADLVPAGTVFPVTATWTDLLGKAQEVELEVKAGQETFLKNLPHGTKVTLTEGAVQLPLTVTWLGGTWGSDDQNVTIAGDSEEVVVTVTGEANAVAKVSLENEFKEVPKIPLTGSALVPVGITALVLLLGGGFLMMRKRRA